MRTMSVVAYGDPLVRTDVDEPRRPSEGFALLEVLTCGVCYSDIKTARGKMPFSDRLTLPHVPGHEICGRVVDSEPRGSLEPGTVVVAYHIWPCRRCSRCKAGEDNLCRNPLAWTGFTHPGGFQDRIAIPIDRLAVVPDNVDPVHAAPMTCALGTAYRAVTTRGQVGPGSRVVVIGLGGVGIHALQIARAAGASPTGLDLSVRAIETAAGLGLDARLSSPEEIDRVVKESGGDGVDVVVDVVGREETIRQAERLVRAGGRIVAVGYSLTSDFSLPTARFVLEEVELVGSRYMLMDELERAIRLVEQGRVRMVVDRVSPLESVNEVFDDVENGRIVGRSVLEVGGVS
jgi:D-arabinose 1-dehydrogenase-like Zn-dependent alcohol dehydrogenase